MAQTITPEQRTLKLHEVQDWLRYHWENDHLLEPGKEGSCEDCELTLFLLAELSRVKQEALAQAWDEGATAWGNWALSGGSDRNKPEPTNPHKDAK